MLVVGAGEAGKLTAAALANNGVSRVMVTSRTTERTADLAAAQKEGERRLRLMLAAKGEVAGPAILGRMSAKAKLSHSCPASH